LGRVVAEEIAKRRVPLVIVDADPGKESDLMRLGVPYLIGSALSDEILERAGVRRAQALVAATASDPDNVFITLSAREKNSRIVIHARGESDGGLRRLRLAGADQAISAYQSGGMRIAASILRPSVVDFLEISLESRGEEVDLEQVRVGAGGAIIGRAIASLEEEIPRLRIVALKRGADPILMVPAPATQVADGDQLVVIGERRSLEVLAQLAPRAR
jgi:voltage-gated potassium channel